MNGIKIEKGIPIPKNKNTGSKAILKNMEIGNSIFIEGKINGMHTTAKNAGIKIITRSENNGFRIWRIV